MVGVIQCMLVALVCYLHVKSVSADIGTATTYRRRPPYILSRCAGYDQDQLPVNGFFVAAGTGIWENGAACGRRYQVRCLSGYSDQPCRDGFVVVEVVYLCRFSACPTIAFSEKAFKALSKIRNTMIIIEYKRLDKAIIHSEESNMDPSSPEHVGVEQKKDASSGSVRSASARKLDTDFISREDKTRGSDADMEGRMLIDNENMDAGIDNKDKTPSRPSECSSYFWGLFCARGGGH